MSPVTSSRAESMEADKEQVVAHGFHEEACGKHVSQTKRSLEWRLSIGEMHYVVCFKSSHLSGKRCVIVNDRLQHEEKKYRGNNFTHSWTLAGHSLSIMPTWAVKEQIYRSFDLSVDGKPFDTLLAGVEAQLPKLKIEILGAQDLQGGGKIDPYCTCEIPNKFGSLFKTSVSSQTSEPVWNHEHSLADYTPGEPLEFKIVDQGNHTWTKSETILGRGLLQSQHFYPFGFEGLMKLSRAGGAQTALRIKITVSDTPEERRLRDIFDRCDVDKDGQLNKRELIKTLRVDQDVAEFFQLPQQIRQEDGSRDAMERLFQEMDTNDDREVSWEEFKAFFARRPSSWTMPGGTGSCPATPEMSAASPASAGKSPRTSPASASKSPGTSPSMLPLPAAPILIVPSDLEGADAHSTPSDCPLKPHSKSRESSPSIGLLEIRPKATKSRRTGKEIKSTGNQSSTASFASAFSDLADFGGFNSSPASAGDEARPDSPWSTFPDFGEPTSFSDFVSSGSPSGGSTAPRKPTEEPHKSPQQAAAVPADAPAASEWALIVEETPFAEKTNSTDRSSSSKTSPQDSTKPGAACFKTPASPDKWPTNASSSDSPARQRASSVPIPKPFPRSSPASQHLSKRGSSVTRSRAATDSPAGTNLIDPWGNAYCPGFHNINLVDPWGYKYVK